MIKKHDINIHYLRSKLKCNIFSVRTKAEACGIVRAASPNEYHKGYLGNCTAPNTCIKNKCVTGGTQYDSVRSGIRV